MLTDVALKNLKSREKPYKVADRDSVCVMVAPSGTVTFRLDYRLNGRRETVISTFVAKGRSLSQTDTSGIRL